MIRRVCFAASHSLCNVIYHSVMGPLLGVIALVVLLVAFSVRSYYAERDEGMMKWLHLTGKTFSFPKTCPCCGGYPDSALEISRSIRMGASRTLTTSIAVPYCGRCIRHVHLEQLTGGFFAWQHWRKQSCVSSNGRAAVRIASDGFHTSFAFENEAYSEAFRLLNLARIRPPLGD